MKKKTLDPPTDFEVDNAETAFKNLEDATRRILSVPKKKIDAMLAKEKRKKLKREK